MRIHENEESGEKGKEGWGPTLPLSSPRGSWLVRRGGVEAVLADDGIIFFLS